MKSDGRRAHTALLLTAQLDLPIVVYLDDFEKECLVVLQMDTSVCCHWFFKESEARPLELEREKEKEDTLYRRTKIRYKKKAKSEHQRELKERPGRIQESRQILGTI